jgi:hypothetical protein
MTRKIAVSAATLTAALLMLSMPAKADNVENVTYPISGTLVDTCSGDTITYTGTEHDVFDTTVNGNTVHSVEHSNIHVTATGSPSGASYVGDQSSNDTENFNLTSPQEEFDVTFIFSAIGQGRTPNQQFMETQHLTVNADGTITVNRVDLSSTCH